jgi:hypothetical protein
MSITRGNTSDTPARASGPNHPTKYISQVLTAAWATITATFDTARCSRVEAIGASSKARVEGAIRPLLGAAVSASGTVTVRSFMWIAIGSWTA